MWLLRLLYGRDMAASFPRLGWVWTGVSFAALAYFVVYKGLRNTSLLDPETFALLADNLPVRRIGVSEDVTRAVLFFADPAASFVTGQVLFVCGGASLGGISL